MNGSLGLQGGSMAPQLLADHSILGLVTSGGFTMYPLVLCSLIAWGVIFERIWNYRRLGRHLRAFHLESMNFLLRGDLEALRRLCDKDPEIPTARLLTVALDRLRSNDVRLRDGWQQALERRRQVLNQELRQNLWIL